MVRLVDAPQSVNCLTNWVKLMVFNDRIEVKGPFPHGNNGCSILHFHKERGECSDKRGALRPPGEPTKLYCFEVKRYK